jgi:hypothetical protein
MKHRKGKKGCFALGLCQFWFLFQFYLVNDLFRFCRAFQYLAMTRLLCWGTCCVHCHLGFLVRRIYNSISPGPGLSNANTGVFALPSRSTPPPPRCSSFGERVVIPYFNWGVKGACIEREYVTPPPKGVPFSAMTALHVSHEVEGMELRSRSAASSVSCVGRSSAGLCVRYMFSYISLRPHPTTSLPCSPSPPPRAGKEKVSVFLFSISVSVKWRSGVSVSPSIFCGNLTWCPSSPVRRESR